MNTEMNTADYFDCYGYWIVILIKAGWVKAEKLYLFGIKCFLLEKDNAKWISPTGCRKPSLPEPTLYNIVLYGNMALEYDYYISITWDRFERLYRIQIDDEQGDFNISKECSITDLQYTLIMAIMETIQFI